MIVIVDHLFTISTENLFYLLIDVSGKKIISSGADPGFFERGFISFKVWRLALLIISNFP